MRSRLEHHWREEDGVIYFTLTSDGTTGPEWIKRTKMSDNRLTDRAEQVLNSSEFVPTNGVMYRVAVLKGVLFSGSERTTRNIRTEAIRRGLETPNPELACLIRDALTDKELDAMGLWGVLCMHEPIKDADGDPSLLGAIRSGAGRVLRAAHDDPSCEWGHDDGFAFVIPPSTRA